MATGKKAKRKAAPRARKKATSKAAPAARTSSAPAASTSAPAAPAAPAESESSSRASSKEKAPRRAKRDPKTGVLNVCGASLEGHPYRCDLEPHTGTRHETDVRGAGGKKLTRIAFDTKARKIIPIS